jgi:hypothetical protein
MICSSQHSFNSVTAASSPSVKAAAKVLQRKKELQSQQAQEKADAKAKASG